MSEENEGVTANTEDDYQSKELAKQLEKLNEYVQQMAYIPTEPHLASKRTERLAETTRRNIVGTYADHKNDLKPQERAERVARIVQKYDAITAEQLEKFIQQHRKQQAKLEENKKRHQVIYHQLLTKLQNQCKQQVMKAIVDKFAKTVVTMATSLPQPNIETESFQCLHKSLVCNMYLALQLPNDEHSKDYMIYNKLAGALANLILQALFLAHKFDDQVLTGDVEQDKCNLVDTTEKDRCIKERTLRAARKKLFSKCRTGLI